MQLRDSSPRAWWAVYLVWIALCVSLFFALRGAEDPSRLRGRVPEDAAAATALRYLGDRDPARFREFEVVNSALYKRKGARDSIWVVLCRGPRRASLAEAIVVEIDAGTGAVIATRVPGSEAVIALPPATAPAGGVR